MKRKSKLKERKRQRIGERMGSLRVPGNRPLYAYEAIDYITRFNRLFSSSAAA